MKAWPSLNKWNIDLSQLPLLIAAPGGPRPAFFFCICLVVENALRPTKPRGVKKSAKRQPHMPPARARGDALGLVEMTLATAEFQTRFARKEITLDHVTPQAFGFAAALAVRHVEKAGKPRRVWILCPDVKTQDHVHAELGV